MSSPLPGASSVRIAAGPGARLQVTRVLARAFADDPAMAYLFPDPKVRARRLPGLFGLLFDGDVRHGMALMTHRGEAASLWRAPDRARVPKSERLRAAPAMLRTLGTALPRALRLAEAVEGHFPTEPFWYLQAAGCHPEAQGQGLGRAAVQGGIERTGEVLPCYLETASERSLRFFEALGFATIESWEVPKGGPRFWSMLRPARLAAIL